MTDREDINARKADIYDCIVQMTALEQQATALRKYIQDESAKIRQLEQPVEAKPEADEEGPAG